MGSALCGDLKGALKAPSSLPNLILLLLIRVLCVCSASFLEEFFSETGLLVLLILGSSPPSNVLATSMEPQGYAAWVMRLYPAGAIVALGPG